jgi:DNA repair exonuclease SbcCD ATPase subunit
MKHIAFRIIVLCVLLPPVCYGFTIQGLEYYLGRQYTRDVEQVCIGETAPLFQGSVRLKDAVSANVNRYLKQQKLLSWGVKATVWVTSGAGVVLYPAPIEASEALPLPNEALEIASENYALLNEGRVSATVDVKLGFGRLLPNMILGGYVFMTILVLYAFYRTGVRRSEKEEAAVSAQIQNLLQQGETYSSRLTELKADRERVFAERDRMAKTLEEERKKAGTNEAELFDEIVKLDENLTRNLEQQKQQEEEIKSLYEKIQAYEDEQKKKNAPREKEADLIAKRFNTLYKNISIHERALSGFVSFNEDMRIKCEEVIHRLNEAPDQVPIKRKVFSGKGRETVLEVLFSYSGRLYFRRTRDQRVEVLVVGSKNTQVKDLDFIDKISRRLKAED